MEYNTDRSHLTMPEYGRNIHKMVEYAISVEDTVERNKIAVAIVNVMGQLNPHLRDVTDFKHKLWDHLFIISNFKLDVDSPYPKLSKETLHAKPEKVNYPSNQIKFKHYGKNVELIIEEIKKLEDGPLKESLVNTIANFMKMAYLNWNRDTVNDELIIEHLKLLSKGALSLSENTKLNHTSSILLKSNKSKNGKLKPGSLHKKNRKRQ